VELVGTANARRAPSGRSRLDAALEKDYVGVRLILGGKEWSSSNWNLQNNMAKELR
jgi:hypothetical protein